MFLKWKAFISISDLQRCSQEQIKKSSSNTSKITWHVKSLCNERGVSAIGLVIATFFLFLLILLPLNLFIQELNLYQIVNHKVQIATEMTCFDAILHLNANAISEEKLVMDANLLEQFETDMKDRLLRTDNIDLDIEALSVVLQIDRHPNRLHVTYEFPYETQFILKGYLSKKVSVELNYELPLNN